MANSIINSDDGVTSGTSGLKTTGGDTGILEIQTNGIAAMTVSDSQVVTFANSPSGVASLSTASGSAPSYSARAWVNFNGTGTVAIRASGNVSSITDNGVGDYTVNFTTAMPDTNYAVVLTWGGTLNAFCGRTYEDGTARSTTSVRVLTTTTAPTSIDVAHCNVAIFR